MQSMLNHYESMCQLSAEMVSAARDNDWDRLGALEQEVARLRELLRSLETAENLAMQEAERSHKRELIMRMLDDDREIRRHTEPWMNHVRALLYGSNMERNLRKAYGATH
jgi:flagellar protein FliT